VKKMMAYTAITKVAWGYPDEGSTDKLGVGYRMNAAEPPVI
jgi:hypothetical protein